MPRKKTNSQTEAKILVESRRICCICFGLKNDFRVKRGQVAHLDKDNTNDKEDNLAFLCFVHHDKYDGTTSQSKNFTIKEVKVYKSQLLEYTSELTKAQRNLANNTFQKQETSKSNDQHYDNKIKIMNVAVYGCFTLNENKNIAVDTSSEEINLVIQNTIKSVSSGIYSFSNSILLHYVGIPKSLPSKWGYENLNNAVKKNVDDIGHLATIHFFYNVKTGKFHSIINCNTNDLNYISPTESVERLINRLLDSNCLSKNELIILSLNILFLVYSQVHLDILGKANEYKTIHYTLDGCEKLALEIKSSSERLPINLKLETDEFLNFWLSHFERYRSITLFHEKEYHGAVSSIFKAISLNPFYPYSNYASLKLNYTKRYAVELVPTLNEMQEYFEEIDVTAEENLAIAEELSKQIEFKETTYHYEILKEIMGSNREDKDVIEHIEQELNKLPDNDPFVLIIKSEIFRYLKKGTKKFNEIYAARLDDSIDYLKKAAVLDSDFPLLYTKIGSLLLIKATNSISPKSMNECVMMYKKGGHFLAQLGFRMRPKKEDNSA